MQNINSAKDEKIREDWPSRIESSPANWVSTRLSNAYETIYLSSWKRPEPYPIRASDRTFSARNCFDGVIYLDQEPIAAQVGFVNSGKATIYQVGSRPTIRRLFGRFQFNRTLIQHVLDVDECTKSILEAVNPYKKNWLPQRRERWESCDEPAEPTDAWKSSGCLRRAQGRPCA